MANEDVAKIRNAFPVYCQFLSNKEIEESVTHYKRMTSNTISFEGTFNPHAEPNNGVPYRLVLKRFTEAKVGSLGNRKEIRLALRKHSHKEQANSSIKLYPTRKTKSGI